MEIVFLIVGIVIGFVIAWLFAKISKKSESFDANSELEIFKKQIENLQSDIKVRDEKLNMINSDLNNLKSELNQRQDTIIDLNKKLAGKSSDFENLQQKLLEQKEDLSNLNQKFNIEFKNLANEILEEKTKKFTEQNQTNIDQILKPLGEKLKEFEKKVEDTYDKESKQRFSLHEEVKRLAELNQQISKDATNLTNALKGESKTQGNWGEVILESILEKSGLTKGREYFTQSSFQDDEGKRLQPDVVVQYPGEKSIVIDSKVSLVAYERLCSAENDGEKEIAMREHLQSVKNHIIGLSSKNYQDIYQLKTLDFVMMFLPIEPAYMLAIQQEPNLWNFAYEKRVLLLSPTNLIASLKMVESLWRQEYQNQNALEIARQGGALYDKLVGFVEDLKEVKKKLHSAQDGIDNSLNKLSEGKGNVLKSAEKIKELGAKTKKNLPMDLLDNIIEEN